MNKVMRRARLMAIILVSCFLTAADDLPGRDDYAYGFSLSTVGDSGFFAVDIPIAVYRSVSDPNLRDAGVFNAEGLPVPRLFEHEPPDDEDVETPVVLGLVPLYGEDADQPEQLRFLLRQDEGGTVFEYETPGPEPGKQEETPVSAYIVDTRELEHELESLELEWPAQEQGFMGKVSVATSDDLEKWRRLASATLADLNYEDTEIVQNRLRLRGTPGDFLRISWSNMPDGWRLESVTGIHTSRQASIRRKAVQLDHSETGDTDREYIFDAGAYPPVDRLGLLLEGENIVLRASLFYRQDGQEHWRQVHSGLFYNISRDGNVLQSTPASIRNIRARHWKLRIDSGVIASPPSLQLGWHPDRLVFLAQGPGPYELVAGRANDRLEHFPQERVLGDSSIFRMLRESGEAGTATLGPRVDIAGAERLEISPANPLRTALLWIGLAAAIILVGWLVLSLSREMRTS